MTNNRFADTSYYLALLNPADASHARALQFTASLSSPIVTSAWVLMELGNALADRRNRGLFEALVNHLRGDPHSIVVRSDETLFEAGLAHYFDRPDKDWSVTD